MTNKVLYSTVAFSAFSDDKMEAAITPEEVSFTKKALKYMLRLIHKVPLAAKTPNQQALLRTAEAWMREYQDTLKRFEVSSPTKTSYSKRQVPEYHQKTEKIIPTTGTLLPSRIEMINDTMLAINHGKVHTQSHKMSVLWSGAARNREYDD